MNARETRRAEREGAAREAWIRGTGAMRRLAGDVVPTRADMEAEWQRAKAGLTIRQMETLASEAERGRAQLASINARTPRTRKGRDMEPFIALADRVRAATGADRRLDGEVFRALHMTRGEEDRWSDAFDDGVWHRRDVEDHVAFEGPPAYTGSIDGADSARVPGMRLSSLREFMRTDGAGPEWQPCGATIEAAMRVVKGQGATLALALLDAALRAHAEIRMRNAD